MNIVETYKLTNNRVLKIIQDDDPESPREWDNNGWMVCFHKNYILGDKHDYRSDSFNSWDELQAKIKEDHDVVAILPLYLYDHSGITISTGSFSCPWDSGQVGFIVATRENLKAGGHNVDELDVDKVEAWLRGEVDTYDQYLRGDIYGFRYYGKPCPTCDNKGEVTDSCWGFFGSDPLENGMMDHLDDDVREELEELKASA